MTELTQLEQALESSSVGKWKAYPRYKDSGVEWLGEIPEHWEFKRLKFVCQINPSKSDIWHLPASTEVSFLPMERIGEDGSLVLEEVRTIEQVQQGFTYFRNEDVILAKITPCFENGKGALCRGLLNDVGFGTTELHVLRPIEELTESKFIFYVTRSDIFRRVGTAMMQGAAGQQRVPTDFVSNFYLGCPSFSEQRAIANFLDDEINKINILIAKKERLIELLQEKRAALISHAVTKGLDLDVKMKDSGVEWLGEIPEHWEPKKIKYILLQIIDTEHKTAPFYADGEYFVVRTSNVRNGKLLFDDAKYTNYNGYIEWTQRGRPTAGDILFTREAPAGEACIVPDDLTLCIGQRMVLFRVNKQLFNGNYGVWALYGGITREFIRLLSQGSTVTHFNMSDIGNIPILLPPLSEQQTICSYLDRETARIDALITKIGEAIEKLKEYSAALISAAVSGKIDVRGEVVGVGEGDLGD